MTCLYQQPAGHVQVSQVQTGTKPVEAYPSPEAFESWPVYRQQVPPRRVTAEQELAVQEQQLLEWVVDSVAELFLAEVPLVVPDEMPSSWLQCLD